MRSAKTLFRDARAVVRSFLARGGTPILMYHSVAENDEFFTVSPENFAHQMRYLHDRGIEVVSLTRLVEAISRGEVLRNSAVITFDDGYEDNYTIAYPILKRYGFPATIFVTTDQIGTVRQGRTGAFQMLSIEQIKMLHDSNLVSIEPHSRTHLKLPSCTPNALQDEIHGSKRFLEELLGTICNHFAYPYGAYTDAVIEEVQSAGFTSACSVERGRATLKSDIFRLPRQSVDSTVTFMQFKALVGRVFG